MIPNEISHSQNESEGWIKSICIVSKYLWVWKNSPACVRNVFRWMHTTPGAAVNISNIFYTLASLGKYLT